MVEIIFSNVTSLNISSALSPVCNSSFSFSYESILTSIIVPVMFSFIILLGTFGNIMVMVVIISNKKMRNSTNILIASLAIADLTFIAFCVPFTGITYATGGWPLSRLLCQSYQYATFVTAYCSVYTLVLMSLDRFLAVVYPLSSSALRTDQNTLAVITAMWIVITTANLPLLINSDVIIGRRNAKIDCVVYYCIYRGLVKFNTTSEQYYDNKEFGKLYFTFFFIFAYVLPLVMISMLYGKLIVRLLYGRTARMAQSSESMKSKRRVTMMIVIVIVVFAICWFPIQCVFMIQLYGNNIGGALFRTIHVFSNCLAYANSMVNPILYAFLSDNFRRSFIDLLFCRKHQCKIEYERTHFNHNKPGTISSIRSRCRRSSKNNDDFDYSLKSNRDLQADKDQSQQDQSDKMETVIFLETDLDA